MSTDRRYIVSYEMQPYCDKEFPSNEVMKLTENNNIKKVVEFTTNCFIVECFKWSEDDLLKTLKADQILYTDDWDNYWLKLINT